MDTYVRARYWNYSLLETIVKRLTSICLEVLRGYLKMSDTRHSYRITESRGILKICSTDKFVSGFRSSTRADTVITFARNHFQTNIRLLTLKVFSYVTTCNRHWSQRRLTTDTSKVELFRFRVSDTRNCPNKFMCIRQTFGIPSEPEKVHDTNFRVSRCAPSS